MHRRKESNLDDSPIVVNNDRTVVTFVSVVVVLLVVSIATTIANLLIIYKLNLLPGSRFFSYNTTNNELNLNRDTFINNVLLEKSSIDNLESLVGNVELKSGDSSFSINRDSISIDAPNGFEVRSPTTGKRLFPLDANRVAKELLGTVQTLSIPNGVRDVKTIRSPKDDDLTISGKRVHIRGNEGVQVTSKNIQIDTSNLFIASLNSSILIAAQKGLYLNMAQLKNRIVTKNSSHQGSPTPSAQTQAFKPQNLLCICSKNGRIFKMPVKDSTTSCDDARFPQSENPCT